MLNRTKLAEELRKMASWVENCSEETLLVLEATALVAQKQAKQTQAKQKPAALTALPRPLTPAQTALVEAGLESLGNATRRDEAQRALNKAGYTVPVLHAIAARLNFSPQGLGKADLIGQLVETRMSRVNFSNLTQSGAATNA